MTDLAVLDPDHKPLAASAAKAADLALIVPTFNERDNVAELVKRFDAALAGLAWEVIFVDDDSQDGTLAELKRLSRSDPRVRFIQRIGRRGLASAVVEGVLSTSTPYIAVLDADLQHDERILPEMLAQLRDGGSDIVVGSRYLAAEGLGTLNKHRRLISRFATRIAQSLMHAKLSDPMSGFFMLKRDAFDRSVRNLSSIGYKILLDVLMSARPPLKAAEVPYVFRDRVHGESKLDTAVTVEYGMLLLDKLAGDFLPIRFVMFMLVGGFGVFVHMAVLAASNQGLHYSFVRAQAVAAIVAMTFNFFVNNALTYRDRRLKGIRQLAAGLVSFYAVCSLGALSNVGIAAFLFVRDYPWYLSGFAGILVGAVWNYAASSILTWRK
jgi:dolichol-phosphate mannosyltransferase